ncbi:MAG: RNA polymerase-binding protein DksA [Hyphomicrobium sp.]|nr:RNA polymerase-binding protein DksA [Hyphomicrobium sp.]KAB2938267.1 MAG: RNA polymerase-binding protein DksA [Hyphomicrobium sp.]MBZ0211808.1 RNA polymerase-binding protein DksA [Hyphomicrobium sp.]MCZ7596056.1 RNA polymerase-binding protein DksA [Hyphomicrobium sp.]
MSKRSAKKPVKAKASPVGRAVPSRAAKRNGGTAPKAKVMASRKTSDKKAVEKQVVAKQKVAGKKMTARAKSSSIVLPPDYRPSEDEPFMNERQRMYFRQKLLNWKDEIIRQTRETLVGLHEESTQHADLADRATSETDRALELRARDRQRKLIAKIDAALARIEDGSYGYCEETGEPIGLKRLDARPIATLSVEAQERHERRERVYRED